MQTAATRRPGVLRICLRMALLALLNTLYIECMNHTLFTEGFAALWRFLSRHPMAFVVCWLLVLVTLLPALFFRRRLFWCCLVSAIWITGGTANGFILLNRMTPLTVNDLAVLRTGLDTARNYLSPFAIVGLIVLILAVLASLGYLFLRGPRSTLPLKKRLHQGGAALILAGLVLGSSWALAFRLEHLSTRFANLAYAYRDYGFSYCFLQTCLNKGIRQPANYSRTGMEQLADEIAEATTDLGTPVDTNVIFVQLESFMDPDEVEGLELSQDAIPVWHALEREYSTGSLTVPVLGAGTANTEFEVLTGMATRFFGPGEYAYQPHMQTHTAESIAYNLAPLGYTSHAIHNHYGTFYSRNVVYANLGFNTFTSLEYMPLTEQTEQNWAKDSVLTEQVLQALDSTDGRDFVFTVSVQCHGSYPDEPVLAAPAVTVAQCPESSDTYSVEYYVNNLSETDRFIGELIAAVEQRGEPCVVVLYSDHLPALNLEQTDLRSCSLYETQYIIWDNLDLPKRDEDLRAYELSAAVLKQLNISNGLITRYHQFCSDRTLYLAELKSLQYDALYGRQYLTGDGPYVPTELQMGTVDIAITGIFREEGEWYMSGEHFTPYCKVTICDEILDTTYIDENTLHIDDKLDDPEALSLDDLAISVVGKHREILSETE